MFRFQKLRDVRLTDEIVMNVLAHSQEQFAFRLMPFQKVTVEPQLPQGIFKIINSRTAEKAFDFDGNLSCAFLRRNQLLGAKINLNGCPPPRKRERVVRNCPPVPFERLPDLVVIDVFCGHRLPS